MDGLTSGNVINLQTALTRHQGRKVTETFLWPHSVRLLLDNNHRPEKVSGVNWSGWLPPTSISDEVKNALPEIIAACERSLVPATHEEATVILMRLSISCRMEGMTKATWKGHLQDFIEDMGELPPDILQEACRRWRRDNKFWPAISEFLKLANPLLKERRRTAERLHTLQRVGDNPAPDNTLTFGWYLQVTSDRKEQRLNG